MSDRRAQRHEVTRQQILAAAWELTGARGLVGWSLRDVAEAVGMRAPSLYVYFDGKDAIYDAMFAEGYQELLDRLHALPSGDAPEETLRQAAHVFVDFCVSHPPRHQLLFQRVIPGFEPSPEAYALAREVLARLHGVLEDLGIDRAGTADLWTALLSGLASQQISNDPGGDRWIRLIDRAVDMFLVSEGARV